jgi:WD40 repeat protein
VIIGIDAYDPATRFKPLVFARNDARAVREMLRSDFGFDQNHTLYLEDRCATKKAITDAITDWLPACQMSPEDVLIVFYAGHGVIGAKNEGYLVAADSREGDFASCVSVRWIRDWLVENKGRVPCRHKLIVLDCCYSGSLFDRRAPAAMVVPPPAPPQSPPPQRGPGEGAAPVNSVVPPVPMQGDAAHAMNSPRVARYLEGDAFFGISAGRWDEPVYDGKGGDWHSVFTSNLLDVLRERAGSREPGQVFSAYLLASEVQNRVKGILPEGQRPEFGFLDETSTSDFLFIPKVTRKLPWQIQLEQAVHARVAYLAGESSAVRQSNPQLSAVLAVESLKAAEQMPQLRFGEADQAVRDAMARLSGRSVMQCPARVRSLGLSPTDSWLVAASDGAQVSGRRNLGFLVPLKGDEPSMRTGVIQSDDVLEDEAFQWSPDGRWLVGCTHWGQSADLWDFSSGFPQKRVLPPRGTSGGIKSTAFSADGRWLATLDEVGPLGEPRPDRVVRLWPLDGATDKPASTALTHLAGVTALDFASGQPFLATADASGLVVLWDLRRRQSGSLPPARVDLPAHRDKVTSVAFSANGQWLASGDEKGLVLLWDVSQPGAVVKEPPQARVGDNPVRVLRFSPDAALLSAGFERDRSKVVLSSDPRPLAMIWDVRTHRAHALAGFEKNEEALDQVEYAPGARWLYLECRRGLNRDVHTPYLFDLATRPLGTAVVKIEATDDFQCHSFSPDGRLLITGRLSRSARVWQLENPAQLWPSMEELDHVSVRSVVFSGDRRWAFTGGDDGSIKAWGLDGGFAPGTARDFRGHHARISQLRVTSDSGRLISGSDDGQARTWSLNHPQTSGLSTTIPGLEGQWMVTFSPDRAWMVAGGASRSVLWSVADPTNPRQVGAFGERFQKFLFSPDSRWLAACSNENDTSPPEHAGRPQTSVWSLTRGDVTKAPRVVDGLLGWGWTQAFSPDGRWLTTVAADKGPAYLWDLTAGPQVTGPRVLLAQRPSSWDVTFSPDDHWLVDRGAEDATANLWDLTSADVPASRRVLKGHVQKSENRVWLTVFSPDGRWLATSSWASGSSLRNAAVDSSVLLWDLKRPGAAAAALPGDSNSIYGLYFSPDSSWLVASERLWYRNAGSTNAWAWSLRGADIRGSRRTLVDHPHPPDSHDEQVTVAFSPSGKWLLTAAGRDDTSRLWRVAGDLGAPAATFGDHQRGWNDGWVVAFSADDRWLAEGTIDEAGDRGIRLHRLSENGVTGGYATLPSTHIGEVVFSGDSRHVVTTTARGANLWRLTPEGLDGGPTELEADSGSAGAPLFTPDHRYLITRGRDVVFTPLGFQGISKTAGAVIGRNLNWVEWNRYFLGSLYHATFESIPVDQSVASGLIREARSFKDDGKSGEAEIRYQLAAELALRTDDALSCDEVCRRGSLDGFARVVLAAGEHAVALEPGIGIYHDTRGLARALVGDEAGAIDDFQAFVDWAGRNPSDASTLDERRRWLAQLRRHQNPFTPELLGRLGGSRR